MIKAKIKAQNKEANLREYERFSEEFSWEEIAREFTWHETGRVNMVYEAIDRWADDPEKGARKALLFERGGEASSFTYRELKERSCQWANLFSELGLKKGDRLFLFLPPCPEVYFVLLGCVRSGIIFSPLYSTLNYDELESIIKNGAPRCFLTNSDLAEMLPLEAMDKVDVCLFTDEPLPGIFRREVSAPAMLQKAPTQREPTWVKDNFPLYLIYTSGATGPPKGVVHVHRDMLGHLVTGRYVLDLSEGTILWTDAAPGWVTGTVYSIFAPWLCGATSVVQGDPFSASTWYRTLERHHVSVWYTTPVTIERLMEAGEDLPTRYDLSRLRHIVTVGEALLPELFFWVRKNIRLSPHDTWWMSETGMICLANFPSMDIKPGSMGKPVPGVEAAVIDESGKPLPLLTMGELALKVPWPAIMSGIWRDEKRYEAYFRLPGWFLTGDMAIKDEDGYYYHQGRMDDLIKVGEKPVGPFEIEQVLMQHPAVWEAAVISKSSGAIGPHLKAFIAIKKQFQESNRLKQEIKAFVRANLSAEIPLKEVEVLEKLPRTSTGKLLRRVLRARELGLPSGNLQDEEMI
jgi:acetyl-CoA synthetase